MTERNPEGPSEPGAAPSPKVAGIVPNTLSSTDLGAPLAPAHSSALRHLGKPAPCPETAARLECPLKLESIVNNSTTTTRNFQGDAVVLFSMSYVINYKYVND
uniref:Uncharacterized protein n=1 Tax=Glossina austeni TaxID=7395 RepID=A0A1A9VLQ3_GLOAU